MKPLHWRRQILKIFATVNWFEQYLSIPTIVCRKFMVTIIRISCRGCIGVLCQILGPTGLRTQAQMQMEIFIYASSVTDISVRTEVIINILDYVIWKIKSLMFKHHMKEMKMMQPSKHLMIQILRFLIIQLMIFYCDINGQLLRLIFWGKSIFRLEKNSILEEKNIFIAIWTRLMNRIVNSYIKRYKKMLCLKQLWKCSVSFYRILHENRY